MPKDKAEEVISLKIDKTILKLMKGIENRSAFIRTAILAALNDLCPFCKGSGVLTPKKKEHWDEFSKTHHMQECDDCHEVKIECA